MQIARNAGAINANEWREAIDFDPMPQGSGGEKYVMQSQYTTLEKIGESAMATIAGKTDGGKNAGDSSGDNDEPTVAAPDDDNGAEEAPEGLADRIAIMKVLGHA